MRLYKQTKRFLLLLAMLSAESFADAQIKVEASETVELMSIISRTAGFLSIAWIMAGNTQATRRHGFPRMDSTRLSHMSKNCGKIVAYPTMQ